TVRAAWHVDEYGRLTVEVTDGGGPTRPVPANPSITARGGRGLNIITSLAEDWGVRDDTGEVTVWASLPDRDGLRNGLRDGFRDGANRPVTLLPRLDPDLDPDLGPDLDPDLDFADLDELA
ncbi:ATP-binding protein, partial [Streptomyces sp. MCAF7]